MLKIGQQIARKTPLSLRERYSVSNSEARWLASVCQRERKEYSMSVVGGDVTVTIVLGGSVIPVHGGNWGAGDLIATTADITALVDAINAS